MRRSKPMGACVLRSITQPDAPFTAIYYTEVFASSPPLPLCVKKNLALLARFRHTETTPFPPGKSLPCRPKYSNLLCFAAHCPIGQAQLVPPSPISPPPLRPS